jgi:hypothetical protein
MNPIVNDQDDLDELADGFSQNRASKRPIDDDVMIEQRANQQQHPEKAQPAKRPRKTAALDQVSRLLSPISDEVELNLGKDLELRDADFEDFRQHYAIKMQVEQEQLTLKHRSASDTLRAGYMTDGGGIFVDCTFTSGMKD